MPYSTKELIQILDQELRAHWKGQRLLLSSAKRTNSVVLDKALGPEKLSRAFAYPDFRAQVHEYQRRHRVSGLIQRQCIFNGRVIHFPQLCNQLTSIPSDKEKLMAAKGRVISFWRQAISGKTLWLAGCKPERIMTSSVERMIQQAEWAELDVARDELYLGLCWGSPEECHYQWARPASGCDCIVATSDKNGHNQGIF
ncbi:MAG: hypothetical protein BRC44_01095 [Cyanobacteria bacterium QS_4_48_99]|nr:MAG: hypothetical protein BRC45_13570 [Cyanobacteria bacterium QS_5_48_63]PSO83034.1 MAG: hypothetical protein BRC44_01095 [Cyanobacteria bacterium QS_4_48_99]